MALQFAVLASGSQGNSALVRAGGPAVLIDVGLGPRVAEARLRQAALRWEQVGAVLVTHTHSDHVREPTLQHLAQRGITLMCHDSHAQRLSRHAGFRELSRQRLVRTYDEHPFLAPGGLRVEPILLSHDSDPTFGFRIEARPDRRERPVTVGYVADTGTWNTAVVEALCDTELLAVEFNHDVPLQRASPRPAVLIQRILGQRGHLSNEQGAELVSAVLNRSGSRRLRHLVLLHLSRECNRPELALEAARKATRPQGRRVVIHPARQDVAFPLLAIQPMRRAARPRAIAVGVRP